LFSDAGNKISFSSTGVFSSRPWIIQEN
jgi:hypothetical protein